MMWIATVLASETMAIKPFNSPEHLTHHLKAQFPRKQNFRGITLTQWVRFLYLAVLALHSLASFLGDTATNNPDSKCKAANHLDSRLLLILEIRLQSLSQQIRGIIAFRRRSRGLSLRLFGLRSSQSQNNGKNSNNCDHWHMTIYPLREVLN